MSLPSWRLLLRRTARRIWFRSVVFSLVAVLLAVAARYLAPWLPEHFEGNIGQDSVGGILQILASSMLAVTTFSLTAMVSAYSSATTLATPRATQLLIQDPTSQNALSTFLGAFLFSIVGIIALSTGFYGDRGRVILFVGTLAVVALIVFTLLRWIAHLTAFGRMSDVIDRVERAAIDAIRDWREAPHLGGHPAVVVPAEAWPVFGERTGYVTHVDVGALQRIAAQADLRLHVAVLPGTLVHPQRPLLRAEGAGDDDCRAALARAFTVERHRSFDHDPRLGLVTLAEIGSRALSAAVNDAGTAIEVIDAQHRAFRAVLERTDDASDATECDRVFVPLPTTADLLEDAFRPLARDGTGAIEVSIRLQKTLAALAGAAPAHAQAIDAMARQAFERASAAFASDADRDALTQATQGRFLQ
ncbi:MAG: DUF2254 domain-containing protein [Gammaproteobacteria bacterium]|uniref:DUF2254 domain-containing protein n=1 Tax=unclassified Pseudacidovorax TaxID=2620592 RepID=UPI001B75CEC2|nr:DUF2254 domain-containing protein [Pseudacidovorax sp.]MBP6898226.1 DUF2254 domain-containing protein [Pseudacidovorax sp.]